MKVGALEPERDLDAIARTAALLIMIAFLDGFYVALREVVTMKGIMFESAMDQSLSAAVWDLGWGSLQTRMYGGSIETHCRTDDDARRSLRVLGWVDRLRALFRCRV